MAPSRHFRLEKLGPGTFAAIATSTGFGLCNAGIVDLGGRTVVFDSMLTPTAGADLARAAERCTGRKPDWVVNSHWHGDHIWGNASFEGAHIVSSRRVREIVLQKSRAQFEDNRREFLQELVSMGRPGSPIAVVDRPRVRAWFRGVLGVPRNFRIVPPAVTFDREIVLEGSRRSLRVMTYGGGHSPSDVFGYLPDEKILFAGDLTMVGLHPSVSDGQPEAWAQILSRIRRLPVACVVPGHGPTADKRALEFEERYLHDLIQLTHRAVRRELSLDEARQMPIPARYRTLRFGFMFPDNVGRAYQLSASRSRKERRTGPRTAGA